MYVAMSDIIIMHYLAVPSQFKGTHDQVGKDLKWLITKLEADGIRSPDAFTAFTNCIKWGYEKRYGDTEWKEYKDDGLLTRPMVTIPSAAASFPPGYITRRHGFPKSINSGE
jgi:hypothetical protein